MNLRKGFLLKFTLSIYVIFLILFNNAYATAQLDKSKQIKKYLAKPAGKYRVGFKDFYWINDNLCPDPNYSDKNEQDFSKDNKRKCHEIMTRIYYPTLVKENLNNRSQYYKPLIENMQNDFKNIPGINLNQIEKLNAIKSYTIKEAPIVDKQFPVIIFSPGFGAPAQIYENIITELVSQGYIVVGVNTLFINGNIIMSDGRLVKSIIPKFDDGIDEGRKKIVSIQKADILYIYNKFKKPSALNRVFAAMDLNNIGLLGHSIGARSITETASQNSGWVKASVSLDMAPYKSGKTAKIPSPFMSILNSNYKTTMPWPPVDFDFEGNKNYIVVTISPALENINYTQHMSYADLVTLQYLPVFKSALKFQAVPELDVKFLKVAPTDVENKALKKPTVYINKKQNGWEATMHTPGDFESYPLSIKLLKDLESELNKLPKNDIEELSDLKNPAIKKILQDFFVNLGGYGNGDGWKITHSVNTYMVQFFDTYLKNKDSKQLVKCEKLAMNTMIECGTER